MTVGQALLQGARPGDFEANFGGIYRMEAAVKHGYPDISDRIACQNSFLSGLIDTLLHGRNVVLGYGPTHDFFLKLPTSATR